MSNPRVSIITPVFKPVLSELNECLRSSKDPLVEHILCLDGKQNVKSINALRRLVKSHGARLIISDSQLGISEASNIAASEARGEFLLFLDQDDFLEAGWFGALSTTIDRADYIYSDSFIASGDGRAKHLWRKPSWSPIRLIQNMYAVHFMAVRKSIFDQVGGFRKQFDGSQDHDLALRISRVTNRIERIPIPLYFWRESQASTAQNPDNKKWAYDAGVLAAQDHLDVVSPKAIVERIEGYPGALRLRFPARTSPVSIVVPTAFKVDNAGNSYVSSLLSSVFPFLDVELGDEIILVHGTKDSIDLLGEFSDGTPIPLRIISDDEDFNFSRRCNIGFLHSVNEHVLLLNDDIEFGSENPLDQLFGVLRLPDVGLVGGLLVFPDFSIQHGGHVFRDMLPTHAHYGGRTVEHGIYDLQVDHEVTGVTGALMFQLKSTWEAVGGFSCTLPLSFNDVDYCQKVRSLGYSIIQANSVMAYHHESSTREPIAEYWETEFIRTRWYDNLSSDDEFTAPYKA